MEIKYVFNNTKRGSFWQIHPESIGIYVRYADDFVVLTDSEDQAKIVKSKLEEFLKTIGLELSQEKTKITHIRDGFDFLGWNFRRYRTTKRSNGEITYIKPSKESIQNFKNNIKEAFKSLRGKNQIAVIRKLNPIITGWANYHKNVVSKATFSKLDNYIFSKLVKWAKRTHNKKSWKWISKKYWGRLCPGREDNWVFGYINISKDPIYLTKLSWTNIVRHNLVIYKNSPDNPEQKEYWEKRTNKNEENRVSQQLTKGKNKVALSTKYKCRWCGQDLSSEGLNNTHLHHIVPRRIGGRDEYKNLMYLHAECHRQVTALGEINPITLSKLGCKVLRDDKKDKWVINKNPK